ncbi:hypothetical protein DICPUDRAFT_156861 [Dictyostelium purpureum]|uniref:C3H1-type domain-containing protein n=1 Tax=Dictyostelium purpureum TaxID=5786 RepID=F0ZXM4_DICPU|nr:uncharacterized protein DICPUDRAFT_156861 [Dictyostelium purpureum]EGC31299.1 hypothetical protein DICPUDRAFT_156861 [Dictyostelium purpureum]|eukprot:XP_003292176.1 hypothetical protein DICPUDRAFT_156861 [Dictyostelium purpureum]
MNNNNSNLNDRSNLNNNNNNNNNINSFNNLNKIPTLVKKITTKNFDKEIISFENDLKNALFISVDTEFTGLGYQKSLKLDDIQDKYQAMAALVKQRSILEFGISIISSTTPNNDLLNPKIDNNNNIDSKSNSNNNYNNDKASSDLGEIIENTEVDETITDTTSDSLERNYTLRVYNFIMLNLSDFQVSPQSMTFLSKHGFNFQELFEYGIPFQSRRPTFTQHQHQNKNNNNNTINTHINTQEELLSRSKLLLSIIAKYQLPVIIHNGIFDLLFIFQSLIADLPDKLNDFIVKLVTVFPKIYDTKYIAEYKINEKRTYLQYLFQKYERFNYQRKTKKEIYLSLEFLTFDNEEDDKENKNQPLINIDYSFSKTVPPGVKICNDFADFGYCRLKDKCQDSHDISQILDSEEAKRQKKKRGRKTFEDDNSNLDGENEIGEVIKSIVNNNNNNNDNSEENNCNFKYKEIFKMEGQNIHSAGFDSAMTGFIFTYFLLLFKKSNLLNEVENKVYLSGKQVPLFLKPSKYSDKY